jgi:hypothetical protein
MHISAGDAVYYKFGPDTTYYDPIPSAVTGLVLSSRLFAGAPIPAGTYEYKVAYKNAAGVLSLPSAPATIILPSAGIPTISWNAVAGSTGYRVYRTTVAGVTTYFDVDSTVTATSDATLHAPTVTFPDTTVHAVLYAAYAPKPITPGFINMAGQLGIFRANGRLGFWDSENSVAWSSIDDFSDFEPSLETLAGSAKFIDVIGRIVSIREHGEGFIIYATQSMVWVRQDVSATFQWSPKVISGATGPSFPFEIAVANPDTKHFAWTPGGLYKIESGAGEVIIPEVTDYLKEYNQPLYLKVLEGRYLAIGLLDNHYINGLVQFTVDSVPPTEYTFPAGASIEPYAVGEVTMKGTDRYVQ